MFASTICQYLDSPLWKLSEKTAPVMGSGCGANLNYRVFPAVDSVAFGWVAGIAPASILSTISSTATS